MFHDYNVTPPSFTHHSATSIEQLISKLNADCNYLQEKMFPENKNAKTAMMEFYQTNRNDMYTAIIDRFLDVTYNLLIQVKSTRGEFFLDECYKSMFTNIIICLYKIDDFLGSKEFEEIIHNPDHDPLIKAIMNVIINRFLAPKIVPWKDLRQKINTIIIELNLHDIISCTEPTKKLMILQTIISLVEDTGKYSYQGALDKVLNDEHGLSKNEKQLIKANIARLVSASVSYKKALDKTLINSTPKESSSSRPRPV